MQSEYEKLIQINLFALKNTALWDVTPYGMVGKSWHLEKTAFALLLLLSPWRWRQHIYMQNSYLSTRLCGSLSKTTPIFTVYHKHQTDMVLNLFIHGENSAPNCLGHDIISLLKYGSNCTNHIFICHSMMISAKALTFSVSFPEGCSENFALPGEVVNHWSLQWVSGLCVSTALRPAAVLQLPQKRQPTVTITNIQHSYHHSNHSNPGLDSCRMLFNVGWRFLTVNQPPCTLSDIPEGQRPQLHCGKSLKSRTKTHTEC